jgi:hypothetical protein
LKECPKYSFEKRKAPTHHNKRCPYTPSDFTSYSEWGPMKKQ